MLGACLGPSSDRARATRASPSRRAYHTPSSVSPAKLRMASRYWRTVASTAARRSSGFMWPSRPATSMLAASRFTSHSQGPGRVSSKSFTSKTKARSGEAKPPKLSRWASPQHWTRSPETGVAARSAAMIAAAPR